MTYNWKNLEGGAFSKDPHSDEFRSPTARGQHPHAFPSSEENRNPQVMYEYRQGFSPQKDLSSPTPVMRPGVQRLPVGEAPPPTQPPNFFSFVADHPFLTFGFGALVFYGFAKLKEKDIRLNPSYPLVANPTTLLLPPGQSQVVKAEDCLPGQLLGAPMSQGITVAAEEVKVEEKIKGKPLVKAPPEKAPPIPRPGYKGRRTTQARNEFGQYLSSGTRKRSKMQGVKK